VSGLFLLFEDFEIGVCAKRYLNLAPQNAPVMPGLDPGIHQSSSQVFSKMDHRVEPGDDDFDWYDGHCEERSTGRGAVTT
jgi:hypothetical protein